MVSTALGLLLAPYQCALPFTAYGLPFTIYDFYDFYVFNEVSNELILHLTKVYCGLTNSKEKLYL
jgi:hypothetical protein